MYLCVCNCVCENECVCVHECVCVRVYMCVSVCWCVSECIHVCVSLMCLCVFMRVKMNVYMYMSVSVLCVCVVCMYIWTLWSTSDIVPREWIAVSLRKDTGLELSKAAYQWASPVLELQAHAPTAALLPWLLGIKHSSVGWCHYAGEGRYGIEWSLSLDKKEGWAGEKF